MNLPLLIISALLGAITLLCGIWTFQIKKEDFGKEETRVLPIAFLAFLLFAITGVFVIATHEKINDLSEIVHEELFPIYFIALMAFVIGSLIISGAYKKAGFMTILGSTCLGIAIGVTIFFNEYWPTLIIVPILFALGYIMARFAGAIKKTI